MIATIADWSSIAGLLAGLVSIGVTLWVANEVSKVRKAYIRRVRIPELLDRSNEITSELSDNLNDFSGNRDSVHRCISQLLEVARSISTKLGDDEKASVLDFIDYISKLEIAQTNEEQARNVYLKATAFQESVSNLRQDLIWQ